MISETSKEHWQVLPTADDVANQALKIILSVSEENIETNGYFRIVLAGGTTPKKIYQLLAKQSCEWEKWHLYLGDERCLPVNDPDRNSEMIRKTLLQKIDIPKENVHFISAENGAESAANAYAKEIANKAPFHLVMLGMGEDGHTASLFPGHEHNDDELVHAVYDSPKPPSDRVSLSVKSLSDNLNLLILVTGKSKQQAVEEWQNGKEIPISKISSMGNKKVLLDNLAVNRKEEK